MREQYDVVIVGAGPAGVGMGSLFSQLGFRHFIILEKNEVGSTFLQWPKETRLLTPSFPGHGFGLLDLNAVVPSTSPGYAYNTEHLDGSEYADYLKQVAGHFKLPIKTGVDVLSVETDENRFTVETSKGTITSRFVIWAGGEFQYPDRTPFKGSEHCIHPSDVKSWSDLPGSEQVIIGGYESGMDAAYHLIGSGKKVTVISKGEPWNSEDQDPSVSLSPYTSDRLDGIFDHSNLNLLGHAEATEVKKEGDKYLIHLRSDKVIASENPPIMATGYKSSLIRIVEHLYWNEDGTAELTEKDESTITEGLFLTGPQVKHGNVIFCFIYKFRQRFAVIAEEILGRLGLEADEEVFRAYRRASMFLDDLSCCDNSCQC
ncbi:hypothetical protein CR205_02835 [Alteribacter lacisalsi]|uniref:Monooxygenase n=1 Tax=Alteribacter lacisalsi TaxID=2045244 RepID=A0A2W0HL09_9BACI|nr:NAD(P)/FAD-dependent oxidoreductase [Alteribacter lacisalsi]PYZ97549.1 hypothetical protein CR205_02835 [Alteribacter lacisalsi]